MYYCYRKYIFIRTYILVFLWYPLATKCIINIDCYMACFISYLYFISPTSWYQPENQWSSSKIVSDSLAVPSRWLPQCSCIVIKSSFDRGERLQAPVSLWLDWSILYEKHPIKYSYENLQIYYVMGLCRCSSADTANGLSGITLVLKD